MLFNKGAMAVRMDVGLLMLDLKSGDTNAAKNMKRMSQSLMDLSEL